MEERNFVDDKFTIDELFRRTRTAQNAKSEYFKRFDFLAKFRHYSYYNTMLVYIQNPEITFFGGKSYWRTRFGRTIKQDAKPHIILAPMGPVMLVYDLMDTNGKQSAKELLDSNLGGNPFETTGLFDIAIFQRLVAKIQEFGIPVTDSALSYFKAGYVRTIGQKNSNIVLNNVQDVRVQFSTLIHEIAHVLLGHTGRKDLQSNVSKLKINLPERVVAHDVEELEAESVTFLICKSLGLETRSAEYMATHLEDESTLLYFSYEHVIKSADKIQNVFLGK
jgi:hypothetical protein